MPHKDTHNDTQWHTERTKNKNRNTVEENICAYGIDILAYVYIIVYLTLKQITHTHDYSQWHTQRQILW